MSNKRPLSPELTNGLINDKNNPTNIRSLKRFKLHSIIEELRNEEANLVLLKKLRASQQLISRTHNTSNHSNNNHNHISTKTTATNGFHSTTATRVLSTNKSHTSIQPPSSIKSIPQVIPTTARKPTNSINPTVTSTKIPNTLPQKSASSLTLASIDERKTQAKKALRSQLERDLLNIPAPKPLLQDISFIPNPTSLEFQPFIGLEDVVQCLYELQMDRQRLPQRLTDRAQVDEPFVCEQCGTDFTIRWWKHLNSNQQTNILCDRCKKQVTRRTLKSEHSTLLKNVFISAMEQEKEIEKTFQTLIKQQQQQIQQQQQQQQQKVASRSPQMTTKSNLNNLSMPSIPPYNPNSQSQKAKIKPSSIPQVQNFATKLSQQPMNATRKSNTIIPPPSSSSAPANRSIPHQKTSLPVHQQQYRSSTALPQSSKSNQAIKMPKPVVRQQAQAQASSLLSSRPLFPPATSLIPPLTLHPAIPPPTTSRPTATKRRTLPPVNIK